MPPLEPHPVPTRTYSKPYMSSAQHLSRLLDLGLLVPDVESARHHLDMVGYHRLRIYFLARRRDTSGRPFIPGTTFDEIVSLYDMDDKLREACFRSCGAFEVLLRNATAEVLSALHGPHPYDTLEAFRNPEARLNFLRATTKIYGESKDRRARHYRETYLFPTLPPVWTMKEFMTFGGTMHFFRNMSQPIRAQVSNLFGIRSLDVFESWMDCMVDLRNFCAHHDRLFNRSFPKQPATMLRPRMVPVTSVAEEKKKLRSILECLEVVSRRVV